MVLAAAQQKAQLVPIEEDHVFEAFDLINNNRHFLSRWLNWAQNHHTIEDTLVMIQSALNRNSRQESTLAGIWQGEQLVGFVGHETIDHHNHTAELVIWLGEHYQGQGLASRAMRAIIRYSFNKLKLQRLSFRCPVDNHRAVALAERLGFQHEGTLRKAVKLNGKMVDVAVFGLLAEDWQV